jgi:hypothetical protein
MNPFTNSIFGSLSVNLFGKRKEEPTVSSTSVIDTITKLKNQLDNLNKRNTFIEQKITALNEEIQIIAKINKNKALIMLEKRKNLNAEILKNEGIINLLEGQITALESSIINKQVTETLREGNNFVKKVQNSVNVDKIEDLIDDIKETAETQKSISDVFTQHIQDIYNDEDLLVELQEFTDKPEINKVVQLNLPEAPKNTILTKITSANNSEEEDLIKLQNSMLC